MQAVDEPKPAEARRKAWMSMLAQANAAQMAQLWADWGNTPPHAVLRAPEIGAVMVRGRAGATGAPFNLGEMTVTRCSVQLENGPVGHGYVQGRDRAHALSAALVDALMQTDAAAGVEAAILQPLRDAREDRHTAMRERAAATKVDFFTLVRGED